MCTRVQVLRRISREGSALHQLEGLRRENQELCCQLTALQVRRREGERNYMRVEALGRTGVCW
jgi:hypothetical protein